jgi:CRISPR-associated endonuclease Csy4
MLHSQSTGQPFRLFLDHRPCDTASAGPFNTYGLSTTATIPWF